MADDDGGVVWVHSRARITLVELSEQCGLSQEVIRELVDMGSLEPADLGRWDFSADCVTCLRKAARLARDLELDTASTALVLRFLQRIERLEEEVRALRARAGI